MSKKALSAMRRVCLCAFVVIPSLYSQGDASKSFLQSISFDFSYQKLYGNPYQGNSLGGYADFPLLKVTPLSSLFSIGEEGKKNFLLKGGIKFGTIDAVAQNEGTNYPAQFYTPEFSLQYPLLALSKLNLWTGVCTEFAYTNNGREYIIVPAFGVDMGLMYVLSNDVSVGIEHRWIITGKKNGIVNRAGFQKDPYVSYSLTFRFSLPWKVEGENVNYGVEQFSQERLHCKNLKNINDSLSNQNKNYESQLNKKSKLLEIQQDSLRAMLHSYESMLTEKYDNTIKVDPPEYEFKKNPFSEGNLVDDEYLKTVLVDVIDEDYVWQISSQNDRIDDAKTIAKYFSTFNSNLSKRFSITTDNKVKIFKISCLGKIIGK